MPFVYMGRYEDAPGQIVFLVKDERVYHVSPGDIIDSVYRFEGIVNGQVELMYLPMNIKQSLSTGEPS